MEMISSDFHGRFAKKILFIYFQIDSGRVRRRLHSSRKTGKKSDCEFDDEGVLFQRIRE